MSECLSEGSCRLISREHRALTISQPPLGTDLELVGIELLHECLERRMVARLPQ